LLLVHELFWEKKLPQLRTSKTGLESIIVKVYMYVCLSSPICWQWHSLWSQLLLQMSLLDDLLHLLIQPDNMWRKISQWDMLLFLFVLLLLLLLTILPSLKQVIPCIHNIVKLQRAVHHQLSKFLNTSEWLLWYKPSELMWKATQTVQPQLSFLSDCTMHTIMNFDIQYWLDDQSCHVASL